MVTGMDRGRRNRFYERINKEFEIDAIDCKTVCPIWVFRICMRPRVCLYGWTCANSYHPLQSTPTTTESEESKDQRERTLYLELLHKYGLLFTPGRSMRNEYPGFFRCVFTAASEEEFVLGLDRIRRFVVDKKKEQ